MMQLFKEIEANPVLKERKLEAERHIREAEKAPELLHQKSSMQMQLRVAESSHELKSTKDEIERATKKLPASSTKPVTVAK